MMGMSDMEIRNPVFSSADNSLIDVDFSHPAFGWIPFTASATDVEPLGAKIFAMALEMQPSPFVAPPPEPVSLLPVTKRQLRLTLVRNGISLAQVQEAINLIPDALQKQEAQIEWDDASSFSRTHPTLLLIASVLGLSEAQVDAMWLEAMAA